MNICNNCDIILSYTLVFIPFLAIPAGYVYALFISRCRGGTWRIMDVWDEMFRITYIVCFRGYVADTRYFWRRKTMIDGICFRGKLLLIFCVYTAFWCLPVFNYSLVQNHFPSLVSEESLDFKSQGSVKGSDGWSRNQMHWWTNIYWGENWIHQNTPQTLRTSLNRCPQFYCPRRFVDSVDADVPNIFFAQGSSITKKPISDTC